MSSIITVENLGKHYAIGHQRGGPAGGYRRLSEELVEAAGAPWRALVARLPKRGSADVSPSHSLIEDFWALRNLSFELKEGEVLGIIGRNGAGKSTLLKILSRITEPSEGRACIKGRVASLLEVGTGFHPELTGRENIFLNGAILGMTRGEIRRKFDGIVEFAEVERFLDTPVKRYSSGMYVRLAFAVATHLEPEILVVDEVLAVGDAEFQKKCITKMSESARSGRTILLVSHNMSAIRATCTTAILLRGGSLADIGPVDSVVDGYLSAEQDASSVGMVRETPGFFVEKIEARGVDSPIVKALHPARLSVTFIPKRDVSDLNVYFGVLSSDFARLAGLDLKDFMTASRIPAGQRVTVTFGLESWPFLHGAYQLEIHLKDMATGVVEQVPFGHRFDVAETPVYSSRKLDSWFGCVALQAKPEILYGGA